MPVSILKQIEAAEHGHIERDTLSKANEELL